MATKEQPPETTTTAEQLLARFTEYAKERKLPPLLQRDFVTVETRTTSGEAIRVMQWNMLAQGLVLDIFTKCPSEALELDIRKHRIVEEILGYQPTVLCMEEVDQFSYLQEVLGKCGYVGTFHPKPHSPCLDSPDNSGPDGCAVFFNSSQLNLIESEKIILKALGKATNQVAIICHFRTKSSKNKDFVVAVTHLKATPGWNEIRKEQATFLTKYLEERYTKYPLIFCGDFNFPPTEPAYDVIKSSNLGLTSAYTHLSEDGQEPRYTFWTITDSELCKAIDYIWYTMKGLTVKSLLNMASEEEVGETRLPSFRYPSDHFSLVCDFVLDD